RPHRVLDGLPALRLEVPPRGGVVPGTAHLGAEQAQDPLGQLRRVLRVAGLIASGRRSARPPKTAIPRGPRPGPRGIGASARATAGESPRKLGRGLGPFPLVCPHGPMVVRGARRMMWGAAATPSAPSAARPQSTARPHATTVAPRANAFSTAVPR